MCCPFHILTLSTKHHSPMNSLLFRFQFALKTHYEKDGFWIVLLSSNFIFVWLKYPNMILNNKISKNIYQFTKISRSICDIID